MAGLLDGKTCVVTGGTRGIGRCTALALAKEGAYVIVTGLALPDDTTWMGDIGVHGRIDAVISDVTNSASVRNLLMDVKRKHGSLDVVVNNAGIEYNELVGAIDEEHMNRTFEINVFGVILMTQYASRVMRQTKCGGSIINIASAVGIYGNPGQSVYAASKGAVISFTKAAAKELASQGIRVNAVAPGLTDTGMLGQTSPEALDKRVSNIPIGRLARPEEIADAVVYLASDRSSYVTGHTLVVDAAARM